MIGNERRSELRIRSKGQVTLQAEGVEPLVVTIYDIGFTGIGVLAPAELPLGTRVRVDGTGHAAVGEVRHCQPRGEEFYIGIALQPEPDAAPPAGA